MACALTAVAASAVTTYYEFNATRADIERLLLQQHAVSQQTTARFVATKIQTLNFVLASVASSVTTDLLKHPTALKNFIAEQKTLVYVFESVFLALPRGDVLVRIVDGEPVRDTRGMAASSTFRRVVQNRTAAISPARYEAGIKSPVVTLMMPVIGSDGRVTAVIGGSLQLRSAGLLSFLNDYDPSDPSKQIIVDADGTILAHPEPSRILQQVSAEAGLQEVYRVWLTSGHRDDTSGRAMLVHGYLGSYAIVAGASWLLVRLTPESQALSPVIAGRNAAWKAGAAIGVIAALLAGWLAWLMTRPIARLRDRAERLLHDREDATAPWPHAAGEVGALSRVFQHVVKQVQNRQAEAQDMLRRLQAVLEHARVGIAFSRRSRFELVSRDVCRILACDEVDLVGQPTRIMYESEEAYQALAARARPAFVAEGAFEGELQLKRLNGEKFWAHLRGRAIIPGNTAGGTIWIIEDVTQRREQRERLQWTANHDALTGLTNRLAFESILTDALSHVSRRVFCALFIDLDKFKRVNDTAGHAAGDAVLKEIARRLEASVRSVDTVARMGGDEFAVLLANCPVEKALEISEKMRTAVESYQLDWQGEIYAVGASIGLVEVDASFAKITEVLEAADVACYAAKHQGRNRVVRYAMESHGQNAARLIWFLEGNGGAT